VNDLESALRAELRSEHYRLDPSSEAVREELRRRLRRRERNGRRRVIAGATAAVVVAIVAVFAVVSPGSPPLSAPPAAQPPGPEATATGVTGSAQGQPPVAGEHSVRGVPAYLAAVPDPRAAMRTEPALAAQPSEGDAVAFAARDSSQPVSRVVVVVDPEATVGLLGAVQQPDWAKASSLGGTMALVTDHEPSSTAYLMAFSPTGKRWFIAVTGADKGDRLSVLGAIATATLPGT
jgi:hypothetical protein